MNDVGEDWREKVHEIGKKKKKKIEMETNKSRNKERKEKNKKLKQLVMKRDEWLVENVPTTEETIQSEEKEDGKEKEPREKNEKKSKNSTSTSLGSRLNDNLNKHQKKRSKSEPLKVVDSFLIAETGETYLASGVIDRIQPLGPNDGLDRKERRAQQFGSKQKTVSKRLVTIDTRNKVENLHPSWAAKMKTKGIDKFQGKKIKFDDEKPATVVNRSLPAQTEKDSEKLHPSWAAKQKLKPVISEFKGSKIVFDD